MANEIRPDPISPAHIRQRLEFGVKEAAGGKKIPLEKPQKPSLLEKALDPKEAQKKEQLAALKEQIAAKIVQASGILKSVAFDPNHPDSMRAVCEVAAELRRQQQAGAIRPEHIKAVLDAIDPFATYKDARTKKPFKLPSHMGIPQNEEILRIGVVDKCEFLAGTKDYLIIGLGENRRIISAKSLGAVLYDGGEFPSYILPNGKIIGYVVRDVEANKPCYFALKEEQIADLKQKITPQEPSSPPSAPAEYIPPITEVRLPKQVDVQCEIRPQAKFPSPKGNKGLCILGDKYPVPWEVVVDAMRGKGEFSPYYDVATRNLTLYIKGADGKVIGFVIPPEARRTLESMVGKRVEEAERLKPVPRNEIVSLTVGALTDNGGRDHNEDYYIRSTEKGNTPKGLDAVGIVADGMGGHAAGEVASKLACETVYNYLRRVDFDALVQQANLNNLEAVRIALADPEIANALKIYLGVTTDQLSALSASMQITPKESAQITQQRRQAVEIQRKKLAAVAAGRAEANQAIQIALQDAVIKAKLAEAVREANAAVGRRAKETKTNMGTTMVASIVREGKVYLANVGDSRAYKISSHLQALTPEVAMGLQSAGILKQIGVDLNKVPKTASGRYALTPDQMNTLLASGYIRMEDILRDAFQRTNDHSLVASLVRAGQIKAEEIYTHPQRNEIFRSLDGSGQLIVDTFVTRIKPGERILLCSDGLWEKVRNDRIAEIVTLAATPEEAFGNLLAEAMANGADDNVTSLIITS
jgi:serine/threonine protein phosphatase PrpC